MLVRRFSSASISIADQIVSSAGNAIIAVLAARSLNVPEFSRFAAASLLVQLLLGMLRAFVSQQVFVESARTGRTEVSEALSFAFAVGFAAVLCGALATQLGAATEFAIVGAGLCFVTLQDLLRYALLGAGRAMGALVMDIVWAVGQVVVLFFLRGVMGDATTAPLYLAAWFIGAGFSAAVGLACVQRPHLTSPLCFISTNLKVKFGFLRVFVLASGTSQLALLGVPLFLGIGDLGRLRGATLLFSPISTLLSAMMIVAVRSMASGAGDARVLHRINLALGVVLGAWAMTLMLIHPVTTMALGESAEGLGPFLVGALLIQIGHLVYFTPSVSARVADSPRLLFFPRVVSAVSVLAFALIGGRIAGTAAVAWGTGFGLMVGGLAAHRGVLRAAKSGTHV